MNGFDELQAFELVKIYLDLLESLNNYFKLQNENIMRNSVLNDARHVMRMHIQVCT